MTGPAPQALEAVPWSVLALANQLRDEIDPKARTVTWPRETALLILGALIKATRDNHELHNPKAHGHVRSAEASVQAQVRQATEAARWEAQRPQFLKVEE